MADSRPFVDFTVEKPGEGIRLLVEAKNTTSPSPEWAARFLRNLFVHAQIPESAYFLLALRNHLYLWHHPAPDVTAPDFEANTAVALQPYLACLNASLEELSESSFELLIEAWLSDLVAGTLPDTPNRHWLEESGLAESVRDGAIRTNIAA
ncbi:MAG TPA: hypothetical protein VJ276_15725 [Thermoanaerobaculia bacterium]|nr:hypothetical protein [Thermoanaerobaculia bacterium]